MKKDYAEKTPYPALITLSLRKGAYSSFRKDVMDAGAGGQADRAAAWRAVRLLAGMAHPAQTQPELPAANGAGARARRPSYPAVEEGALAPA